MKREIPFAMVVLLATIGPQKSACEDEGSSAEQLSAAALVREVIASEAWIRDVDSCLLRTQGVQWKPAQRAASSSPDAEEFERLRSAGDWREAQRWRQEIAWDRKRVRTITDYPGSGLYMASAWDGKIMIKHQKMPERGQESYGLHDDSRQDLLVSFRVNLWDDGGRVTGDLFA